MIAVALAMALTLMPSPAVAALAKTPARPARKQPPSSTPVFTVDGKFVLASFISLTEGHLRKLADALQMVAERPSAHSANWQQLQEPLRSVARRNVPAVLWFALPDGSYWTLEQGRASENLASRPYFPRVLAGQTVIGDMVVSKSTGKSTAIIAVPVFRPNGSVAGVLGASVYLEQLSTLIKQEMNLDDTVIFYTFDAKPLLGLVWDSGLILVDPTNLGEAVGDAFREMLTREQGKVTYTFRNIRRTVLYRKSPLTGWWYAFGILHQN
jgi:methyl-accepting chemotaxis protein